MSYETYLELDGEYFCLTANRNFSCDTRLQDLENSCHLTNIDFMQAYFDAVNINCTCYEGYHPYAEINTETACENRNILGQLAAHFDVKLMPYSKETEALFG